MAPPPFTIRQRHCVEEGRSHATLFGEDLVACKMSTGQLTIFLCLVCLSGALAQVGPGLACDNIVPDQTNHFDLTTLRNLYDTTQSGATFLILRASPDHFR